MASPFPFTSGQVLTAAQLNGIGEWTTFTANPSPETGTWTSSSVTRARYALVNDVVVGFLEVSITNFGTGSGRVFFNLPVTAAASAGSIGSGRENSVNGYTVNAYLISSSSAAMSFYDNAATAGANYVLPVFFVYEAA